MHPRQPRPSTATEAPPLPQAYAFDDFVVDLAAAKLLRGAQVLALPSRIFDVLVFLIRHRERPVKKDEIIATIWDNVIVTDDSLIHAISVLRRTLGDEPHEHRYIETIPRRGYRFVGKVHEVEALAVDDPAPEPPTPLTRAATGTNAVHAELRAHAEPVPDAALQHVKKANASPEAADGHDAPLVEASPAASAAHEENPAPLPAATLPPQGQFTPKRRLTVPRLALAAALAAAVIAMPLLLDRDALESTPAPRGDANRVSLVQPSPPGMSIVSGGVLSPDGRYLAFVARDDLSGKTGLWVRALQSQEPHLVKGTEGATKPFWSPDSTRIGYFANGTLFTSDLNGAAPHPIASVAATAGASWGQDGTILFADWSTGIYAVPASGDGSATPLMLLERESQDIAFGWPQYLPDSKRFLYQVVSLDTQRTGVYIGDTATRASYKLLDSASSATFAPPHHLLYVQKDMLIAEEIDPQKLELVGHAVVVARGIAEPALAVDNAVSASADMLAFRHGLRQQNMVWYNRDGETLGTLAVPAVLYNPRLSPDGLRLMASSSVTNNPGLWLTKLDREEYARVEHDALAPIWAPDGQRIAYTSRDGMKMLVRGADGPGVTTRLMSDAAVKVLSDWTPDGSQIVYTRQSEQNGLDLWRIDVATGVTQPLLATANSETQARISPDGEWIAYASDESGVLETYVARFPGLEDKRKVSIDGGGQPQWRADQGELFYLAADQTLMAVAVTRGIGQDFATPRPLFRTPITGNPGEARDYYAVNASGTQFLIDVPAGAAAEREEITVLINWAAGLHTLHNGVAQAADSL